MADKNPATAETNEIEVEIDPEYTTLEDLLNIAEKSRAGTVLIKGETDEGGTQWGLVVTCCERSGDMMDSLETSMNDKIADWIREMAN